MRLLILAIVILFSAIACTERAPQEKVLFDFETDAELDRINWRCFTLFSLSNQNVTHGAKSLRVELYPSSYPGWAPKLAANDWRKFKTISFDVHNPADKDTEVAVRIDDKKDYPNYSDRFNKSFIMKPGLNKIKISLNALITSGSKRKLDLENIYRFLIFMVNPQEKHVLYLDYVRLVRDSS